MNVTCALPVPSAPTVNTSHCWPGTEEANATRAVSGDHEGPKLDLRGDALPWLKSGGVNDVGVPPAAGTTQISGSCQPSSRLSE